MNNQAKFSKSKTLPVLVLVLTMMLSVTGATVALADNDKVIDPPRTQTATNGLVASLVAPDQNGPIADQSTQVVFRVIDSSGKPVEGLQLSFTGVRDYSGQVDKEHNGPRDPNVGPYDLKPTGTPGEYGTTGSFHNDGHWYFKLAGASLNGQTLTFTQRVQVNPGDNGGIRIDWIVWPSVLVIVLVLLVVVGTRGEKLPVPAEEDGAIELALSGKGGR